jgi:uncharacterized protein (DUF1015 family)
MAGPPASLTAPPYDVITPSAQDRLYEASPFNVVRLILGRDEPGDDDRENKYTRGASLLRAWLEDGVLVPTRGPCVYPYEMSFRLDGRRRTLRGLIVEMDLEPFGPRVIPHERILPGPLDDRLRLLRAVPANLSPVYAVAAGPCSALGDLLARSRSAPPTVEVVDEEGTGHRLWAVDRGFDDALGALEPEPVMIADGHHRYTVALRHREQMRRERGPGPWDAMMVFLVDAATEDPPVRPIHRVVHERIAARSGERPVRDLPEILASLLDEDLSYGVAEGHHGTVVHRVGTLPGTPPTVCALHAEVLDAIDPSRIDYVPDAVAAAGAAASGRDRTAFLLPPTRVDRVWAVAAGGGVLPQKSTYFWPKPRTGLVIRPLASPD